MAEYIEREALLEEIDEELECEVMIGTKEQNEYVNKGLKIARKDIKNFPAADVVEVVRCKDCKHLYCCSAVDRQFYCIHIHGMQGCLNPIEENPYCSYGEKKEGAEE